jgi:hypothetical protein
MKTSPLWPRLLAVSLTALLVTSSAPASAQDEAPEDGLSDPFAPEDAPMPPVRLGDDAEEPVEGAAEDEEEAPAVTPYTPRRRVESRDPDAPRRRSEPRPLYEDEQQPEPQRHAMPVPSSGGFGFAPSAGAAILLKFDDDLDEREDGTEYSFPLWIGATMYPWLNEVTPFVTLNFGFDLTLGDVATSVSYMPNMRLGVAVLDGDPHKFENQLLPLFMGYLIAGARYNPGIENERIRLGVGISSPIIVAASLYMCANGLPIPNMIEYVAEVDVVTRRLQHTLMFGIGL